MSEWVVGGWWMDGWMGSVEGKVQVGEWIEGDGKGV